MPEGAECRIQVDYANKITEKKLVVGCGKILSGKFVKQPYRDGLRLDIPSDQFHDKNQFTVRFFSKGKFIWAVFTSVFDDSKFYLMNTLGMTGSWINTEDKHNHFEFTLSDGSQLFFNDPRHFGNLKFTYNYQDVAIKLRQLGANPLGNTSDDLQQLKVDIDLDDVVKTFRKYDNKNICEVLMNQKVIAGVGNYVKCEALYRGSFSPFKLVKEFTNGQLKLLAAICCNIIREAYKAQGASFKTFETGGERGSYSNNFKVYGKCKNPYGGVVYRTETPDGRTTHYCLSQIDYVAEPEAVTID